MSKIQGLTEGLLFHISPSKLFYYLFFFSKHAPSAENWDFSFLAQGVPAGLFVIEAFVPAMCNKKGKVKKKKVEHEVSQWSVFIFLIMKYEEVSWRNFGWKIEGEREFGLRPIRGLRHTSSGCFPPPRFFSVNPPTPSSLFFFQCCGDSWLWGGVRGPQIQQEGSWDQLQQAGEQMIREQREVWDKRGEKRRLM